MYGLNLSNPGLVGVPHSYQFIPNVSGESAFNVYERAKASGWNPINPTVIQCLVDTLVGNSGTSAIDASFYITGVTSGSKLYLNVAPQGVIKGRGGNGGATSTAGDPGYAAIYTTHPLTVINSGLIYGGGGGGGGAAGFAGGGGGGGYIPGVGADGGSNGTLFAGGAGLGAAGAGGAPGLTGVNGSVGHGGAPGYLIQGSGAYNVQYSGPGTGAGSLL